jgi:hypothetical protein
MNILLGKVLPKSVRYNPEFFPVLLLLHFFDK